MPPTIIGLDIETHLITDTDKTPRPICTCVCIDDATDILTSLSDVQEILHIAKSTGSIIVGHNISFDMSCITKYCTAARPLILDLYSKGRIHCTMVRAKLLDIATIGRRRKGVYSLGKQVERRFGVTLEKDTGWRTRYAELETIPLKDWPKEAQAYVQMDVYATMALYEYQEQKAIDLGYSVFFAESARQAAASFSLYQITAAGLAVDKKTVEKLQKEVEPKICGLREILTTHELMRTDGSVDTKKLVSLVEQSYPKGKALPKTDPQKKNPKSKALPRTKTDEETIKECDHPLLVDYAEFKKLQKIQTTYLKKLYAVDSIHPGYNELVSTGRTSSYSPNIQNQPRGLGIRECFVSRPGKAFVMADYDCQELRTLAQACVDLVGYSTMAERFKENIYFDPHLRFAATLMDMSVEESELLYAQGDEHVSKWRQRAKAGNFGFPGGLGAPAFRAYAKGYGLILSLGEATAIRDAWFLQWPEMRDYFGVISRIADQGGLVAQLGSGRLRARCHYCAAANTFFQGRAADITKAALFRVVRDVCTDEIRPVWFIHDEIALEVPIGDVHTSAQALVQIMEATGNEMCKDVKFTATAVAMVCWSKKAKPMYEEGKLVPWTKTS